MTKKLIVKAFYYHTFFDVRQYMEKIKRIHLEDLSIIRDESEEVVGKQRIEISPTYHELLVGSKLTQPTGSNET